MGTIGLVILLAAMAYLAVDAIIDAIKTLNKNKG